MDRRPERGTDPRQDLLDLYDRAVGEIHGYLRARCGSTTVAEDLTSETFLAAAAAVVERPPASVTVAWLVGIARNKLVDHWRRTSREERARSTVETPPADDPWDVRLDVMAANRVLTTLGPHHRSALTLRYLDDLPVREVAAVLGRTEGATEVLLVRARAAFRSRYEAEEVPS